MRRDQFTTFGNSPLLLALTYKLQSKFSLVAPHSIFTDKTKKLVLIDAETADLETLKLFLSQNQSNNLFYCVLSSDKVYTDLDSELTTKPLGRMSEDWPTVIPSVLDPISQDIIKFLYIENLILSTGKPTTVIRPFGIVHKDFYPKDLLNIINKNVVYGRGDCIRTYLLYEEFETATLGLIERLLQGRPGIYNIGNDDFVTYKHLVENIENFQGSSKEILYLDSHKYIDHWKIPDITRISATLHWRPQNSIRKTLWRIFKT